MKPRHNKTVQKGRRLASENAKRHNPVDQLGIKRGQNAEKGNTINPHNIGLVPNEKEAAH